MKIFNLLMVIVLATAISAGCSKTDTSNPDKNKTGNGGTDQKADDSHDGHDHAAHTAPHGGHLIELGRNHEYHAELVDDHKTETATVYIMDGDMKPLSLTEESVSLILTAGDKTETFELKATQAGGSSEYMSEDEGLMSMVDGEHLKGKLRVTIDGKPFTGSFDHHGHDHDH